MGFLLFAFMKLSLKRTINHKEFRLSRVLNKINNLQEQTSIMAQAKSSAQSALTMFFQSNNMMANNMYQQKTYELQSGYAKEKDVYAKVYKDNKEDANVDAVKEARKTLETVQTNAQLNYQSLFADFQKVQMGNQMSQQLMSSIFTSSDQMQQSTLHAQETQLTTEKDGLESELKGLNAQYDSYKQSEDKAAKDLAPNFGTSG